MLTESRAFESNVNIIGVHGEYATPLLRIAVAFGEPCFRQHGTEECKAFLEIHHSGGEYRLQSGNSEIQGIIKSSNVWGWEGLHGQCRR